MVNSVMLKNLISGKGPPVTSSRSSSALGPWTWYLKSLRRPAGLAASLSSLSSVTSYPRSRLDSAPSYERLAARRDLTYPRLDRRESHHRSHIHHDCMRQTAWPC